MAKKRSIGVTIFGWWYVAVGVLGIFNLPVMLLMRKVSYLFPHSNTAFIKQFTGSFYLFYILIVTVASLIAGVGILKLKPWARKLVIILCVVGMLYSISFSINTLMHSSEFVEMSLPQSALPKGASPEMLDAMRSFTQVILFGSMILGMVFGIGFVIFVIWFFRRKSVMEQFQPGNKDNLVAEQIK